MFLTETCKSFVKYNHEIIAGNQSDIGWTIVSSSSKLGLEGVVRNGGLLISADDLCHPPQVGWHSGACIHWKLVVLVARLCGWVGRESPFVQGGNWKSRPRNQGFCFPSTEGRGLESVEARVVAYVDIPSPIGSFQMLASPCIDCDTVRGGKGGGV